MGRPATFPRTGWASCIEREGIEFRPTGLVRWELIPVFAAGTMVVGMALGTRLGPRTVVKLLAWAALTLSGIGAFFWESEPFASLVAVLGVYYAILAFTTFNIAFGVLLGLLYRSASPEVRSAVSDRVRRAGHHRRR